jgi:hypothetical protein
MIRTDQKEYVMHGANLKGLSRIYYIEDIAKGIQKIEKRNINHNSVVVLVGLMRY